MFSKNTTYSAPDPLASHDEKSSKEYGLKFARFLYSNYLKGGSPNMFWNARHKYRVNEDYAMGSQSIDQYKERLDVFENDKESYVNINWAIRNYATKRINVAVGMLAQEQYDVIFQAIDPTAIDDKKNLQARMQAIQEQMKFIQTLGIATETMVPEEFRDRMPQTKEEIDLFMNMDYKHKAEMEMELGVSLCMEVNNYEQIKKEMAWDRVVLGVEACKIEMGPNGFPVARKLHPGDCIVPYSKYEDFRDIKEAGDIEFMSVQDFAMIAGGQLNQDEIADIAENYATRESDDPDDQYDAGLSGTNAQSNETKKVKVLNFAYLCNKTDVYEKGKDKRGNTKIKRASEGRGSSDQYKDEINENGVRYRTNGKSDIYKDKYEVVYCGKWVVGSNYIIDYGLKTDMEVAESSLTKTRLPYHFFAPNMKNGKVVSVVDQMKPKLDDIQNYELKVQQTVASAVPKGININYDALLNANVAGGGGEKLDPYSLLRLYFQRGIIIYSDTDYTGQPGTNPPISESENGMAGDIVHFMNLIQTSLISLDEIVGTNAITSASTPHQKTLVGVAELQVAATNNAFYFLFQAQREMFKSISRSFATLYIDAVKNGSAKLFAQALGKDSTDFVGKYLKKGIHEFGMFVEIRPSQEQWAMLYAEIKGAVDKGVISPEDRILIERSKNLKQAQQIFAVKIKQRQREAQEAQERNAQMTFQGQQESAQFTSQLKIGEMEKEKEVKLAVIEKEKEKIQLEWSYKLQALEKELGLKLRNDSLTIAQEGDQEIRQIKEQGEVNAGVKVIDNMTKPKKEEKEKAPK